MCEAPRLRCCGAGDAAAAVVDVDVVTTGGRRRIPARSSVLVSVRASGRRRPSLGGAFALLVPERLNSCCFVRPSVHPADERSSFLFPRAQASASPVLASILERRLRKDRESGKAGRSVVRIRGVTDDAAAAFVRLLDAGRYRAPAI